MAKWQNHFISGKLFQKRPNLVDLAFKKAKWQLCYENPWQSFLREQKVLSYIYSYGDFIKPVKLNFLCSVLFINILF
jgi:hypothetical protein